MCARGESTLAFICEAQLGLLASTKDIDTVGTLLGSNSVAVISLPSALVEMFSTSTFMPWEGGEALCVLQAGKSPKHRLAKIVLKET